MLSKQEYALRLPNDIEVRRIIENLSFYNFRLAKYILCLVEENLTKARPDMDDEKLQIEHIMPQKLNEDWEKELGVDFEEIKEQFLNNIGNLTLIRHNQELKNIKLKDKKDTYEGKAGLQIAKKEITNRESWNKNSIINRMKWIIGYLLETVFPIPEGLRKTNNYKTEGKHGLSLIDLQLIGEEIEYIKDCSIKAKVVGDKEIEFEGKKWKLSPLVRELETRRGTLTPSGAYSGAQYWEYDGIRLSDIY